YYNATSMEGHLNIDRRREINEVLAQARGFVELGELDPNAPIVAYPAYTTNFNCLPRGRFLLAGDACNVTTPYGGQGMTAGLEHVTHLLEKFDFERANEFSKRRYQLSVESTFSRISLLNFGLYYLFFARSPLFKASSSHVIDLWEANPE